MDNSLDNLLLEVRNLTKHFPIRGGVFSQTMGFVYAVNGISFTIRKGETVGLAGESGCGKSTVAKLILRLIEPTAGEVKFDEVSLFDLDRKEMQPFRQQIQIIFQDPYAALNPRLTVESIIGEAMRAHKMASRLEIRGRIVDLLEKVGLQPEHLGRYPHEFSGGQRQRIGIARALALRPKLVIGDEPVSALDVSIQAQVLNLLMELQEEFGLSYLLIAHDLRVLQHMCDRVAVMYLGRMMEMAISEELYEHSLHPYTEALLSAVPVADPLRRRTRIVLKGDIPSPIHPPSGCPFHSRCMYTFDRCKVERPELKEVGQQHWVACHLQAS